MPGMDTTPADTDPIEHVRLLLARVADIDPSAAVEPLAEIAELLESLLDGGDEV